jgi:hypothetical protein
MFSEISAENLRIADRIGFDVVAAGVLVWVERAGNRSYLHTAEDIAVFDSLDAANRALNGH